jgi:hypothetical protein
VSVVVQKQSEIEYPKPDLLNLDGGGLQRSLGRWILILVGFVAYYRLGRPQVKEASDIRGPKIN